MQLKFITEETKERRRKKFLASLKYHKIQEKLLLLKRLKVVSGYCKYIKKKNFVRHMDKNLEFQTVKNWFKVVVLV